MYEEERKSRHSSAIRSLSKAEAGAMGIASSVSQIISIWPSGLGTGRDTCGRGRLSPLHSSEECCPVSTTSSFIIAPRGGTFFFFFFLRKRLRALPLQAALEITCWETFLSDTYHPLRKWSLRQAVWHPEKLKEDSVARGMRDAQGLVAATGGGCQSLRICVHTPSLPPTAM